MTCETELAAHESDIMAYQNARSTEVSALLAYENDKTQVNFDAWESARQAVLALSAPIGNSRDVWYLCENPPPPGTHYASVADGNWDNPATWTPTGVPASGDTATISHSVTITSPAEIGDIEPLTITGTLTVNSTLVLDGIDIDNSGTINVLGSQNNLAGIRGNVFDWSNSHSEQITGKDYRPTENVHQAEFDNGWVSNSTGDERATFGDSSIAISNPIPSSVCQTEVATITEVDSVGKYYVDYDNGMMFIWHDGVQPKCTINYQHLTFEGSLIDNSSAAVFNASYCEFRYLGGSAAKKYGIEIRQPVQFEYNSVKNSRQFLGMFAGGEIKNNTFGYCETVSKASCLGFPDKAVSGLSIFNNTINSRTFCHAHSEWNQFTTHEFDFYENSGRCAMLFSCNKNARFNCDIHHNIIEGFGAGFDGRFLKSIRGASGTELCTVRDNTFSNVARYGHVGSHVHIHDNTFEEALHHGFTAVNESDELIENVLIEDNVFTTLATPDNSPVVESGYNERVAIDGFVMRNNTITGGYGMFGIGDTQDPNSYSMISRAEVYGNTVDGAEFGFVRANQTVNVLSKIQLVKSENTYIGTEAHSNFANESTARKSGIDYNTDATRNVLGVALFEPVVIDAVQRSLSLVVNSATDQTLQWGTGSPVQLVKDSGTITGTSSSGDKRNSTLTDSSKSWPTNMTDPAAVRCRYVKADGQIRRITNNTATKLTVVPPWTSPPVGAYEIIESEVVLTDGSHSVHAGIYLEDLPSVSATDGGITVE